MRLIVKNKAASLRGSSKVLNEKKESVYFVKGSWSSNTFSKKYKKTVMSMDKKPLFIVCNKRLHGLKRGAFIYDANKKEIAIVRQESLIKYDFEIESPDNSISMKNGMVKFNDKNIGSVYFGSGKSGITLMDSYTVEVDKEEYAPLLVAIAVAMDNIYDAEKRAFQQRTTH